MSKVRRATPRRAWTVILVPPRPGEATHQIKISTRTVAGFGLCALALVAAAATWTGATSSIAASTADRLAASQRTVVTLLDSVHSLGAAAEHALHLPPKNMLIPVAGQITSAFSMSRLHPILGIFREHRGVDIGAPRGTPIVAAAPGRVRSVGWRLDYGLTVEIEHTGEIATRYAHCTKSYVHAGDVVQAGDTIATVGTTGLASGPHVHFEVIDHGKPVDPIQFLARSRAPAAAGAVESTQGWQ